jgi:hypothetical protein
MLSELTRFFRGALGLSKVAMNLDRAPIEVTAMRQHQCNRCPQLTTATSTWPLHLKFGPYGCSKCRCFIGPKTTLAGEKCPLGKW